MSAPWLCPNVDCSHRARTGAPAELPADVPVCPHCGVDGDAFVPMEIVATFPEPYLAHLVRSRLEADGIVATISDEHLASMTHVAGEGGVKLRVRRDQVEAALAIMQGPALEDGDVPEPETTPVAPTGPACPRCGAPTARRERPGLIARLLGARCACERCGHAWRA